MKSSAAFTLVELLVVLVIMGVLAALAYPSYAAFVLKARRAEGQAALHALMLDQERYYLRNNRYLVFSSASTDPQAQRFKWWSGNTAAGSAYELQASACEGQSLFECVELKALPGTAAVDGHFRDRDCGTLSLRSNGERSATGAMARCWP
jgi:type IV pilus assembly protein PilE